MEHQPPFPRSMIDGSRHWQRVNYANTVDLQFGVGETVSGVTCDVSVSGTFVEVDAVLGDAFVGAECNLLIKTDEGSMQFPGRIVRSTGNGIGIHFDNDQTALGMFVTHDLVQGHLSEINDILSNIEGSESTYDDAVAYIQKVMSCEGASLFLLNDDGKVECRACSGPVDIKGITLEQGEGIVGQTIATGEARHVQTASGDPQFSSKVDQESGFSTESIICAPLTINGETFGALEVVNLQGHDLFPGHGRVVLSTIASSAAMAIYTARQSAILAEQRRRTDAAELANEAKSEFLATMSHEIRTPLFNILGFADMLARDDIPPESLDRVARIAGSGNALLKIVNDILDISKLEAGKLEIEPLDFNAANLIEETMDSMSASRPDEVKLDTAVAPNFPEYVHADPTRIRQVLLNLIGNAVKFTHKGAVIVSADLIEGPGRKKLKFAVHDTGIGISEDAMADLFDKFTQADTSVSRTYDGTGLGLAICKRLVELMDGEIGAESTLGKGSQFWFTVPFVEPESDELSIEAADHVRNVEVQAVRKLRILVAEDNEANQLIISSVLAQFGHDMRIVGNGRALLEVHKAEDFDLILMDVRMPEMSGTEAASLIRRMGGDKWDIPIIALTADAMPEHRRQYKDVGMDHVVTKPINHAALASAIDYVMEDDIHRYSVIHAEAAAGPSADLEAQQEQAVNDFLAKISDR